MRIAVMVAAVLVAGMHAYLVAGDDVEKAITKVRARLRDHSFEFKRVTGKSLVPAYAGDLLREYEQNAASADESYTGKVVLVGGQVNRVAKYTDGTYYMIVTAPEIEGQDNIYDHYVVCRFQSDENSIAANYKSGDSVVIDGKCLGLREGFLKRNVYLEKCGVILREFGEKLPAYEKAQQAELKRRDDEYEKMVAEEAKAKKEKASQATLKLAKKTLADGDEKHAREWLKKVIAKYPDTPAAKEAADLLKGLE